MAKCLCSHVAGQRSWLGLRRRAGGGGEALVARLRPTSRGNAEALQATGPACHTRCCRATCGREKHLARRRSPSGRVLVAGLDFPAGAKGQSGRGVGVLPSAFTSIILTNPGGAPPGKGVLSMWGWPSVTRSMGAELGLTDTALLVLNPRSPQGPVVIEVQLMCAMQVKNGLIHL